MSPNDVQTLMTLLQRLQREVDELKVEIERLEKKLKEYESNYWILAARRSIRIWPDE